ncbi:FitA-like ribbon-helix-helix domain-containing protein [Vulcanococcus limneticus]|uniref:FitA-like ribbon-helix-helix domain-containing protein n=1 Tax=Vulcanococcus limneticus TaxID=2170428 RepID=UPI00398C2486
MATLTLHDIPEEVLARLEQRAQAHGRSLNSEVLDCLTRQSSVSADTETWLQQVEALRTQLRADPISVDDLVAATERHSH